MSCDDGDSFPRVGLRAGTIRSKYGLRSSRAGARHHDGGRHPGHGLVGRLALLLGVAHRGQDSSAAVSTSDDRPLRRGLTASRTAHRQVGQRTRILVAMSASARAVLCWMMSEHLNSLWLFPLAFLVLISSKLYVVTRVRSCPRWRAPTNCASTPSTSAARDGRAPRSNRRRATPVSTRNSPCSARSADWSSVRSARES